MRDNKKFSTNQTEKNKENETEISKTARNAGGWRLRQTRKQREIHRLIPLGLINWNSCSGGEKKRHLVVS